MRHRPWPLVILAILHFLAPLGNIALNAVLSQKSFLEYLVFAMSPRYLSHNWIVIVMPIVAGFAIYACKKWSFYVYLAATTILFAFSFYGYLSRADSMSIFPVLGVYFVNIVIVCYFLIPAVRNLYFDRRMRWWEMQSRYKCNFRVKWRPLDGDVTHRGRIGNFSENGCFLKSDIMPMDNQQITITLPVDVDTTYNFIGEAIQHNKVGAIGFGVRFDHTIDTEKAARKIVTELDSQGMRIANLDVRPEDSFSYWARTLVTTGKGLLPKREKSSTM